MQNAKTRFIAVLITLYIFATLACVILAIQHSPSRTTSQTVEISPPPIFSEITDIAERKQAFFNYLTPIIEQKNQTIKKNRQRLANMKSSWEEYQSLSHTQRFHFNRWLKRYKISDELDTQQQLGELDKRMNVIPSALVLAQAANESAWGTSRFALKGNNYFGQWCFTRGCGIVPSGRGAGAKHEVRRFSSPADSVDAYFRNINTHRAYRQLRSLRATLQANGQAITGHALAAGLTRYSERGEEYVKELRAMMKSNKLESL